jgi:hypothetical protein
LEFFGKIEEFIKRKPHKKNRRICGLASPYLDFILIYRYM